MFQAICGIKSWLKITMPSWSVLQVKTKAISSRTWLKWLNECRLEWLGELVHESMNEWMSECTKGNAIECSQRYFSGWWFRVVQGGSWWFRVVLGGAGKPWVFPSRQLMGYWTLVVPGSRVCDGSSWLPCTL